MNRAITNQKKVVEAVESVYSQHRLSSLSTWNFRFEYYRHSLWRNSPSLILMVSWMPPFEGTDCKEELAIVAGFGGSTVSTSSSACGIPVIDSLSNTRRGLEPLLELVEEVLFCWLWVFMYTSLPPPLFGT